MLERDHNRRTAPNRFGGPFLWAGDGILKGAVICVTILAAAVLTRLGLMDLPPEFDELYHFIPALGWGETGELAILDGSYTRAAGFTLAVALFLDLTGQESLAAARVVALVPGLALPLVLFWWLRGLVGNPAAAIATFLAVLWPQGIVESQLLRFYSLHVLIFFCGAVAVYAAATKKGRARWGWGFAALFLLATAALLQITTIVACAGLALWLAGRTLLALRPDRRWVWVLGGAALTLVVLALAWPTGALEKAWALYRFSPGNAIATRDYVAFYHNGLRGTYETLWSLSPVAALMALRLNAQFAWFCVAIFGTVFVVQSFGAMKADRYISGAMPFFFAVWGMAAAWLIQIIRPHVPDVVAVGCIGFLLASNGFVISSAKLALGSGYDPGFRPDFSGTGRLLEPWRDVPFLATTHELHMVVEMGDYDVDLRQEAGWDAEFDAKALFGRDPRNGRFAVQGAAGMARLLACVRSGVLVTEENVWKGDKIGGAFRRAAAAGDLDLTTRQAGVVVAVRWDTAELRVPNCNGVPEFRPRR